MAPEIMKKKYNYKVDLWAAGVLLYILIAGEPPFKGEDDPEVLANIKSFENTFEEC